MAGTAVLKISGILFQAIAFKKPAYLVLELIIPIFPVRIYQLPGFSIEGII